jgi:hypothetical protein
MLYEYECKSRIGGQMRKQGAEGFQSSGRGPYADYGRDHAALLNFGVLKELLDRGKPRDRL